MSHDDFSFHAKILGSAKSFLTYSYDQMKSAPIQLHCNDKIHSIAT